MVNRNKKQEFEQRYLDEAPIIAYDSYKTISERIKILWEGDYVYIQEEKEWVLNPTIAHQNEAITIGEKAYKALQPYEHFILEFYWEASSNMCYDIQENLKGAFDIIEFYYQVVKPLRDLDLGTLSRTQKSKKLDLPHELDTPKARAYFDRAVEVGLMDDDYKWQKGLQLLACFAREMSLRLKLGKGDNRISWKPFEQLFSIPKGKLRSNYNDVLKVGQSPVGSELLDKVFQ